jgi:hypothetical protein
MGKQFTPPGYHTVEDGDWLSKIAQWYGFHEWQPIWNHGNNSELKSTRDPNVCYPGDQIYIPELTENEKSKGTDATHPFVVKAVPDDLTIILLDDKDKGRKSVAYAYNLKATDFGKGNTGADGKTTTKVPKQHDPANFRVGTVVVKLKIGGLNPMDKSVPDKGVSGVQARLNNLGLRAGAEDGILGDRTKRSITLFQKLEKITVDGSITDELIAKLKAKHGI